MTYHARPITYTPEQLDMMRAHFKRCGAPSNRIGLDHWLATQVPPTIRRSIMAQLFPEPLTRLDVAQDLVNWGLNITHVRDVLASWRIEPEEIADLLAKAFMAKNSYSFPHKRCGLGLTVDQEWELLTPEEREEKTRAARESWARARQLEAA